MKPLLILAAIGLFCLQAPKVYICRSGTSYAYHNKYCRGLQQCTHKIDTVTIQRAIELKHGKACGWCYK